MLPLGGPKGSGLSFMIECLCSLTVGNPIIAPALAAGGALDAPFLNGVAMAVDLAAFGDVERILAEADRLGDQIRALPPDDSVERIYLPGERGDSILEERTRDGIPLAARHVVPAARRCRRARRATAFQGRLAERVARATLDTSR